MRVRIGAIDMLRGLTIAAMILVNNPGSWGTIYAPLAHASWHGYTPTDLVFPFFICIVGMAIYIVYKDYKTVSATALRKLFIRSIKIIGLGLILSIFLPVPPFLKAFESWRFPGVLQRIGLVFGITSLLFLYLKPKTLYILGIALLLLYWVWLGYIPLPDGSSPTFERAANNWANYLDLQILGSHMWKKDYDPEGLLSTIPAITSCISGIWMAQQLLYKQWKNLLLFGFGALAVGHTWDFIFPINKALWSSSFVCVTSGWAAICLALLYYLMDIKQIRFGKLFQAVGMNALIIFFASGFIAKSFYRLKIGDQSIHGYLYAQLQDILPLASKTQSLVYALLVLSFYLSLGWILYKKKIFIKV